MAGSRSLRPTTASSPGSATAIGRPELAADERFATNAARVRNRDELIEPLESVFARRSAEDWVAALDAAGVPAGKIRGVLEALGRPLPQRSRVEHPTAGPLELVAPPFALEPSGLREPAPPPLLGQHTARGAGRAGPRRCQDRRARGGGRRGPGPTLESRPWPRSSASPSTSGSPGCSSTPASSAARGSAPTTDGRSKCVNPATGEPARRRAADGRRPRRGARSRLPTDAFPRGARRSRGERAQILRRWADLMLEHADDLALLLTLEQGKPLVEAKAEVDYAASFLEWFGEEAQARLRRHDPAATARPPHRRPQGADRRQRRDHAVELPGGDARRARPRRRSPPAARWC